MNHLDKVDHLRLSTAEKSTRAHKAKLGQFMTPSLTARFMASLFSERGGACRLLDPGAGIGSLSSAFLDRCATSGLKFESISVTAPEIDTSLHPYLNEVLTSFHSSCGLHHQIIGGDFIESAVNDLQFRQGTRFTHAIVNPPYKKINTGGGSRLLLSQV